MKIRPYPGKIALVQNQDGVEKEVTMNYESSWQECLQLWGPQNGTYAYGGVPTPKSVHYAMNGGAGAIIGQDFESAAIPVQNHYPINNNNGKIRSNGYSADTMSVYTDSTTLSSDHLQYNGSNEPISSHSFNYYNNYPNGDAAIANSPMNYSPPVTNANGGTPAVVPSEDKPNGVVRYARQQQPPPAPPPPVQQQQPQQQRYHHQQPTTDFQDSQPQHSQLQQTSVPYQSAGETVAGCSIEYVNPSVPLQSFPATETTSWVIPETVPTTTSSLNGASAVAAGAIQNGYLTTNHYPYKNHRKLYRTPTMIDKTMVTAALPYVRAASSDYGPTTTDVPSNAAVAAVEINSSRVPLTDNGFLIPRPKLIVPVHTYGSRKRRTGNILHSKRRGSDTEPSSATSGDNTSTNVESKKHHTSCPGKHNEKYNYVE